jgi:hypothetical protein
MGTFTRFRRLQRHKNTLFATLVFFSIVIMQKTRRCRRTTLVVAARTEGNVCIIIGLYHLSSITSILMLDCIWLYNSTLIYGAESAIRQEHQRAPVTNVIESSRPKQTRCSKISKRPACAVRQCQRKKTS